MRRHCLLLLAFVCLTAAWGAPQADDPKVAAAPPHFTKDVRPILKTYCYECHNENKRRGGLNLAKLDSDEGVLDLNDLWDQVGERLRAKEMPPAKSKQPAAGDRDMLMA